MMKNVLLRKSMTVLLQPVFEVSFVQYGGSGRIRTCFAGSRKKASDSTLH